jgi:hypothetical protein
MVEAGEGHPEILPLCGAAWTVVAGNPARVIKRRVLEGAPFNSGQVESPAP